MGEILCIFFSWEKMSGANSPSIEISGLSEDQILDKGGQVLQEIQLVDRVFQSNLLANPDFSRFALNKCIFLL